MNDQLLTLLILVAIAAVLLFRLRGVIGTRTGHDNPNDYFGAKDARGGDNVVRMPGAKGPDYDPAEDVSRFVDPESVTGQALIEMKRADRDFDVGEFLEGAKRAYEMILLAFEQGDKDALEPLLAEDVFEGFAQAIDARAAENLTVDARFIGVRGLDVVGATFDQTDGQGEVTIKFTGEMTTVVRNAEHEVVEGDPNEVRRQTDVWTFGRKMGASDPNWLLVATGG